MKAISPPIALIGYSGHAWVVAEVLTAAGRKVEAYFDQTEKKNNPYNLAYLGSEKVADISEVIEGYDYFIAVGNNPIRQKIHNFLADRQLSPAIIGIHPNSVVSETATIEAGVLVCASATINAMAQISTGAICNTGAVIEHECQIGAFAHVAPGAVLAGNVQVGPLAFIGANAVVKQGIRIGKGAIVGAGAVVVKDVSEYTTVVGNPARQLKKDRLE